MAKVIVKIMKRKIVHRHGSLVKERHLETDNENCSVSVFCHTLGKWNLILDITCHLFSLTQIFACKNIEGDEGDERLWI